MKRMKHYKTKGRPLYTAAMLRYALLLRYTSAQSYKLLLEKFPFPSVSLLNKIQQGGIDSVKAITLLREKGEISDDIILMVDEMYNQKATQYQSGEYVGVDNDGRLYKGVVDFMIAGLKKSIPYVVQALPGRVHQIVCVFKYFGSLHISDYCISIFASHIPCL